MSESPVSFFAEFVDAEWAAICAFYTEPDAASANAVGERFRKVLRGPGVLPNLYRTKYIPAHPASLQGVSGRSLFAVAEHGPDLAVAYASTTATPTPDILSARLLARRTDAGWQVIGVQLRCRTCDASVGPCPECGGARWLGAGGQGPADALPPPTGYHRLKTPSNADSGHWLTLERDHGSSWLTFTA